MNNSNELDPTVSPEATAENGNERWGIILMDSEGNAHRFVRHIGEGAQSLAQLCQRIDNGQLVVRKRDLETVNAVRAARPDRECAKTVDARERQAQDPAAAGHRFANLVSNGNFPSDEVREEFYRESFWDYYNGGGSFNDFLVWLARYNNQNQAEPLYPHALILSVVHSVITALQWLNDEAGIYHFDAGAGNIWLQWASETELVPVIGDFEFARRNPPEELAFIGRAAWNNTPPDEQRKLSHPPPDVNEPYERMPRDFIRFINTINIFVGTLFRETDEVHERLVEAVEAFQNIGQRERRENRKPPFEPRRALVNLEEFIEELMTAEQWYLAEHNGAEVVQETLRQWRAHLDANGLSNITPTDYATREAALAAGQNTMDNRGPWEVVDVSDPASVRAGIRALATQRFADLGSTRANSTISQTGEPAAVLNGGLPGETVRDWFHRVYIPDAQRQLAARNLSNDERRAAEDLLATRLVNDYLPQLEARVVAEQRDLLLTQLADLNLDQQGPGEQIDVD